MMVALELENLAKVWPELKIKVDLKVEPGNLLALAGPSGCGKSTVLRMIAGLCPPDSGKIKIDGKDVTALSPKDREVGMVFQDYALFPHLDVLANVAYGLTIRGMPRKKREILAIEILDSVGMRNFGKRHIHELSGGEKQRIALARTLATRPRVVLFDEPLSSLDAAHRKHLRSELREQQRRFGLTALYVTHDLEEAMAMADNVAIMYEGGILQCASPKDLWLKPGSAAVARFLGSGPCLPILQLESSGSTIRAITATGRFGIQAEIIRSREQNMTHSQEPATKTADAIHLLSKAFLFFERTAAKPVSGSEALQICLHGGGGTFHATCLRTDFAGDAVDCLLQAGEEKIPLRMSPEKAPSPGEQVQFMVNADRIHLIFQ